MIKPITFSGVYRLIFKEEKPDGTQVSLPAGKDRNVARQLVYFDHDWNHRNPLPAGANNPDTIILNDHKGDDSNTLYEETDLYFINKHGHRVCNPDDEMFEDKVLEFAEAYAASLPSIDEKTILVKKDANGQVESWREPGGTPVAVEDIPDVYRDKLLSGS